VGGGSAPRSEPICGFDGLKPECQSKGFPGK